MSVGIACALGSHNEVYPPPPTLLILSILLHLLYKVDVIVLTVALSSRPHAASVLHGSSRRGFLLLHCPVSQWGGFYRAMRLFTLTIVGEWCILITFSSYCHKSEAL